MAKLSGWRRIASAMWRAPNDPQIYGQLDLDATAAVAFLREARERGHRLTVTHLVGRAVARALEAAPDLNVQIRGLSAIARPSVDVFFIAAIEGGHDLSGVKVRGVDRLTALEVATELEGRARKLRTGRDPELRRSKAMMDLLPRPLLSLALRVTYHLAVTWRLDVPPLGLHASPFGSAMVTSVGMLGLPQGFAPLGWMYGVPLLVLVGELDERPMVVDRQIVARTVLPLSVTIDHRYVDGWHLSTALAAFREYLLAPARFEPPLTTRWSSPSEVETP